VLEDWANTVALVALGLGLGSAATLAQLLAPAALRTHTYSGRSGESVWEAGRGTADETAEAMRTGPRPFRFAAYAQLAFGVVLAFTVWLSPVELKWLPLLASVGAGALLTWLAFRLGQSQSGKMHEDPASGAEPL
jgi:hypothetical protein